MPSVRGAANASSWTPLCPCTSSTVETAPDGSASTRTSTSGSVGTSSAAQVDARDVVGGRGGVPRAGDGRRALGARAGWRARPRRSPAPGHSAPASLLLTTSEHVVHSLPSGRSPSCPPVEPCPPVPRTEPGSSGTAVEHGVLHLLDDQLGDPVAAPQLYGLAAVEVHEVDQDLPAVAGVDRTGRVHDGHAEPRREAGAGVHEACVPIRQRDRHPGADGAALPRGQHDVVGATAGRRPRRRAARRTAAAARGRAAAAAPRRCLGGAARGASLTSVMILFFARARSAAAFGLILPCPAAATSARRRR